MAGAALRAWWHTLFDPCPQVLHGLCPPDGVDLFERFLAWADEARPSMGWSLHLHLLRWLLRDARYSASVTEEMLIELLAAAASRWTIYDRSLEGGLVIGCQRLGARVVTGWKCHTPDQGRTVHLLHLSRPPALEDLLAFFTVGGFDLERIGPWERIPG
jgi:methanobactin biosynthesis cassette protein MbnC